MGGLEDLIDDGENLPKGFTSQQGINEIADVFSKTHTFQDGVGYVPNSQLNGVGKVHINGSNPSEDFLKKDKE